MKSESGLRHCRLSLKSRDERVRFKQNDCPKSAPRNAHFYARFRGRKYRETPLKFNRKEGVSDFDLKG